MIKIERCECPKEFTGQIAEKLTAEYMEYWEQSQAHKDDPVNCPKPQKEPSVWKNQYIKTALLESSHGKCAFCETRLEEEGKYTQIEHFFPKSLYPKRVADWENLLPSCGRCNLHKGDHDTGAEPIINPAKDLPSEHLTMRSYRVYRKTKLGQSTIEVLDLNDKDGLQMPRFRLGWELHEQITGALIDARLYDDGSAQNSRRRNRIVKKAKEITRQGGRESEYSATMATAICESQEFLDLKEILERHELWDGELDELYQVVLDHSLL